MGSIGKEETPPEQSEGADSKSRLFDRLFMDAPKMRRHPLR